MSMPLSPTRLFTCTACGAVLPVGEEQVGKKCRCGRCGKVSVVGEDTPRRRSKRSSNRNKLFSFPCRICQTNLAARAKDVGRKAKCPDCGALTAVPEPPKPRPKQIPRAMHGQQYGLWGVDEAPTPAELAARQPKFFPVFCHVCDTLMHARPKQVGKKLACPDCGAKTLVKEPPPPKPKKSVLVAEGEEYQLDAAQTPPQRPLPQFVQAPEPLKTKRDDLQPIRQERTNRPKLPLLPTVQGVLPMLMRGPIFGWWLWLSVMSSVIYLLLNSAFNVQVIGIPQAMYLLCCFAMSIMLGVITFIAAAAICLRILTESSEGNDRLHDPPSFNFVDWFGDGLYWFTAGSLATAPFWLIGKLLEYQLPFAHSEILFAGGWLLAFPVLLLSCLEKGSPVDPISPKVIASLLKRPGHWLLLVVQSLALSVCCAATIAYLTNTNPALGIVAVPVCVAAALLYFRVLGRFAWWLAESLAEPAED